MSILESECFEEFVNEGEFYVTDAGPLHHPINKLTIKRNSELNIIITATANHNAKSNAKEYSAGTVRKSENSVTLESFAAYNVSINGVEPSGHSISKDIKSGTEILTESAFADSIVATIQSANKGKYLIEWLENVDDSYFNWPDCISNVIDETTRITIGKQDNEVTLKSSSHSKSFGRKCVHINVDGFELYLSKAIKETHQKKVEPGFILYKACPTEEVRKKIRNCLSFSLGRPLIYIGYSIFCDDWKLVTFKAISAYSLGEAAFNLHTMPPAPLGRKFTGEIDSMIFSRLVNSLYDNYEICNFGHVVWSYWHAVCTPVHIAAVHFGASIEALQRSYIENNGKTFSTRVISKSKWKEFRDSAIKTIAELDIGTTERSVLENKISSLNQLPKSLVTDRFLKTLNISLSELELSAWEQRNNAAHGKEVEDGDYISLIREVKAMRVVFNRILLKMIEGSDFYFDYYSIGFPIRNIGECIPNEA